MVSRTASFVGAAVLSAAVAITAGGPAGAAPARTTGISSPHADHAALSTREDPAVTGLAPGSGFSYTPAVRNTGDLPTQGVALFLLVSGGVTPSRKYDNCRYHGPNPGTRMTTVYCEFPDTAVGPGEAYEADAPMTFRAAKYLMEGSIHPQSWPLEAPPPFTLDLTDFTRGTAPAPAMRPTSATATYGEDPFVVETTQHADFAAVGGEVRGRIGQEVDLRVGMRNRGPGIFSDTGSVGWLHVTLPAGVSFAEHDHDHEAACTPDGPGTATRKCAMNFADFFRNDFSVVLHVRIDRAVSGARGGVTIAPERLRPRDTDRTDDVAPISVRVQGPVGGGPAKGAGGTLAATGGGEAGGIAGAAVVAVVLGVGGVMAGRRRTGSAG